MKKKYSYLFYSFETDRQDSSPIIDEEFDDAKEEDYHILQRFREIANESKENEG
tara:strand:- start:975 stop:1136 length:162 start_codon:yes stop_codon:yes gene_type:complete